MSPLHSQDPETQLQPPPLPPRPAPTLLDYEAQAQLGQIVFRVHTAHSASPLVWTGDPLTSGFASPNPHLALLTPTAYTAAFTHPPDPTSTSSSTANCDPEGSSKASLESLTLFAGGLTSLIVPWKGWDTGSYMRHSVVDHVTRRTTQSCVAVPWEGEEVAPDDASPWISVTSSASWCIWEVARRLGQLGDKSVEVAIVCRAANGTSPIEATLDPSRTLDEMMRNGTLRMSVSQRLGIEQALYVVRTSNELLFFGRIFSHNIVSNLEFTQKECTLDLPPWYYRSPNSAASFVGGWLGDLVWNPWTDDYGTAMRLIERRRSLWGEADERWIARAKDREARE